MLNNLNVMTFKFRLDWRLLIIPIFLICISCAKSLQPVVLFYIDDGAVAESKLREIARNIATAHDMKQLEFDHKKGDDVDFIFASTLNNWFYHQGLIRGNNPDIYVTYQQKRICVDIVGPPENQVVYELVDEWTKALDMAGIKYTKDIQQEFKLITR